MTGRNACQGYGMCVAGCMCGQGACMAGGMHGAGWGRHGRVVCMGGMHGRRDGHYSGRYASYWSAFLFASFFELSYYRSGTVN